MKSLTKASAKHQGELSKDYRGRIERKKNEMEKSSLFLNLQSSKLGHSS